MGYLYLSVAFSGCRSQEVIRSVAEALGIDRMELELGAHHLPDEFVKVVAARAELRALLALAARNRLSDDAYWTLNEIAKNELFQPTWHRTGAS